MSSINKAAEYSYQPPRSQYISQLEYREFAVYDFEAATPQLSLVAGIYTDFRESDPTMTQHSTSTVDFIGAEGQTVPQLAALRR